MNESALAGGVFRQIVDQARDLAIFVLDERGVVELWNIGAERTFGWKAEEIVGRNFDVLFVPEDRKLGIPQVELENARRTGRGDDTRWHLRKDGSRIFVDGVNTKLEGGGFSKFARDITDRYLTEQRLSAQLALTNLLSRDESFSATARQIMQVICENLGWDIGGLWQVRDDSIECIDFWHAPHVDEEVVRGLCQNHGMARGVGLIGLVWDSGEAIWVPDFGTADRFPRSPLAREAGLVSAFAFPIVTQGRVIGAMEFFSIAPREPEQAMLPVMTLIGAQIGDFIERRSTHHALRESEMRYRLVSETAQDAIFTMNERGEITFCNQAVERILGYGPQELVGQRMEVIIPERLREQHRRGVERYVRSGEKRIPWTGVELPALHKDGHEVPCEISFGEWREDGRHLFTGFVRDITERVRSRDELKESLSHEQQARAEAEAARAQLQRRADEESAFRHLASALTGAVEMTEVLYEITNRATHVTRADGVYVERIIGSRMVEVVSSAGRGTPPRGLRVGFPGSLTEEILRGGQPVILAEMNQFGRQMAPYVGDACPNCEVLVTPLVAENEALGALVLLNSASSGRRFRETDVVRARTLGDLTSLALRRVRLMEEEREAKEKAEAAVRVRDETLGIVSHDLRNPLTKIALSADLLGDTPPEEQKELVETIRSSARQMERLIQDLLDVARLEAGRFSVDAKIIDATSLVREVCDTHAAIAQQKRQRIECNVGELPRICADRDRLVQVFNNLIGNAIKFTPEGGTIAVTAEPIARAVEFVVRDTGPGIPEADLGKVFTPYWQAKKTAHMGAGLGLAIVKGIIEAHRGEVWAANGQGSGAVFTFTIPTE
jgi:PAS domain S-box-containing protein